MYRKFLFIFILIGLSFDSWANNIQKLSFNLGTHTEFFDAVQKDNQGTLRKFDFAPTIGMGVVIPMTTHFNFMPEINWVLPQMLEDSKIMVNTFMFRGDIAYDLIHWMRLRLGTGLIWQNQHGRGGKTSMNNGNDQSTFYYPDENRSSLNNTLDIGGELMYKNFSLRLQTYIYSVFITERRQISYTLFLTYYWDRTTK